MNFNATAKPSRPVLPQTGLTLRQVTSLVKGNLRGDPAVIARSLCSLEEPTNDGITFIKSAKNLQELLSRSVRLAALLVPREFDDKQIERLSLGYSLNLIEVPDPFRALISLVPSFYANSPMYPGIDPGARVDPSAQLGKDVSVGAFAWVGPHVVIGDGVTIYPQVCIYPGVKIGPRSIVHAGAVVREHCVIEADCIIQPGAIIGAEGFGYLPDKEAGLVKVPQIGTARLAPGVEIGANACVDRATLGSTVVGKGTKIDNLVQVGHNTKIGQFSIICGLSGLAGSCKIGNNVVLGGAVGVQDHAVIADGIRVAGRSEVWGELRVPGDYQGTPAIPHMERKRQLAALAQLPEFFKKFKKVDRKKKDPAA